MKRKHGIALIIAAFLILLAFFAGHIPFYLFQEPLKRVSLQSVEDELPLSFTYENDAMLLHGYSDEVVVYGLTENGISAIPGGMSEGFPSESLGTLAAVRKAYPADTDGDSIAETLIEAAKTDMEFTQEHVSGGNAFLDERIPFEAAMTDRSRFCFTLYGSPLSNAAITAVLDSGREVPLLTDENGMTDELSLNDFRRGVLFIYRPDSTHTYRMSYQWEDNTLFTSRWRSALNPFLLVLLLSAVTILLDILLRKKLYRKGGMGREQAKAAHPGISFNSSSGFERLRWSIMIISFVLLIFGGRLIGYAFSSVHLPVLAYPYNIDQPTEAACYMFSHLAELAASSPKEILWFAGSFIVCALVFGRILCGFICPLGFVQDVMHELRQALHTEGVPLTEKMYAALRFVKWILLLIFLGIGFIGGNFCNFCPAITLSPALAGFKTSIYFSGFMMMIVLVNGFFKRRCFCNICPMGYMVGLFHKLSLFRLKKDAVACTECGACYEACPMGIKSIFTIREGKDEQAIDVTTADCLLCGACIRSCPEDHALYMTFAGKKIYTASRLKFLKANTGCGKIRKRKATT